jgi:hypothetical protein
MIFLRNLRAPSPEIGMAGIQQMCENETKLLMCPQGGFVPAIQDDAREMLP